jgi:hypothetical protein
MVVLWEPKYFTRLWCVYELAAFVHINDKDCRRLHFFPLKLSALAIALPLFHSVSSLLFCVVGPWFCRAEHAEWAAETIPEAAQYPYVLLLGVGMGFFCLYGFVSPLCWTFCKSHMRDRKELLQQVQEFKFESALCQEERDREFVREQIERWFGGVVEFEHYVHTIVLERVEEMLHKQGPVPYNVLAVGSLVHVLVGSGYIFEYAFQDGIPNYANLCIMCVSVSLFSGHISMRLVLYLAGTSFGDVPADGTCKLGRLSGPLATAMICSICISANIALVAAPLWLAILLVILQLAVMRTLYYPSRALSAMLSAAPQESDVPVAA